MKIHAAIGFIVKCAILGLAAAFVVVWIQPDLLSRQPAPVPVPEPAPARAADWQGPVSYAEAVNRTAPSVVSIYTRTMVNEPMGRMGDPLLQGLYGDRMTRRPRAGLGSGVILSSDGHILTTLHVIADVDDILVALWDGRVAEAQVVGADPATDLAVLRIELDNLPAAALSAGDRPRTGDVVLAIGNAFGLSHTVTMGIVSATGRGDLSVSSYEDLIQTDAAINSGNSGGALINPLGEVIGINSSSLSQAIGAQGISFAVPADLASEVMAQIIEHGRVRRAWLGAGLADLPIGFGTAGGNTRGVQITEIIRGGPAWRAGLRPGDILVATDGNPVRNARQLMFSIAQEAPGRELEIMAIRNGQGFTTSVTLIQQPPLQS